MNKSGVIVIASFHFFCDFYVIEISIALFVEELWPGLSIVVKVGTWVTPEKEVRQVDIVPKGFNAAPFSNEIYSQVLSAPHILLREMKTKKTITLVIKCVQ